VGGGRLGHAGLLQHRLDACQVGGGGAGEEVVERQHGVRLAAAEVGLQLDDRITARAGEALQGVGEQVGQAVGEEGAPEELGRIAVLATAFAIMHLAQVGGELRLLVAAGSDVAVRRHDLPPGAQARLGLPFHRRHGGLAVLVAHLLVVATAQQLLLLAFRLGRLRRGDGGE